MQDYKRTKVKIMSRNDLDRLTVYTKRLLSSHGCIGILTDHEREDLARLLKIWLEESQWPEK